MNKRWYAIRTSQALFTIYMVITLTFVMIRYMPGGPLQHLRAQLIQQQGGSVDQQEMQRINSIIEARTNVQPDLPVWEQYMNYMVNLLQGNLGESTWFNGRAVSSVVGEALPWTIFLMSVGLFLTFAIGIALGAGLAYLEGSRWDLGMTTASMFLNSIPYYVAAILLVYVLGYQFDMFPTRGRLPEGVSPELSLAFLGGLLYHAALPVFSLVITGFGGRAMGMRGNSVRVMGEDYVRVAELRGLKPSWISLSYVARNAILPMYTNMLISIGFMFGGAIILEEIFGYYGVGYYMIRSINSRDYPLMMGCFLVITIAVVIAIYIGDLTYGKLDPRAGGGSNESY